MKTNPNEPLNCNNGNGFYQDELHRTHAGLGLTKREYFAAMAMQSVLISDTIRAYFCANGKSWASEAVRAADHLIEELNKEK